MWIASIAFTCTRYICAAIMCAGALGDKGTYEQALEVQGPFLPIASLVCLFGALLLRFGSKGFAAVWFPLCFLPLIVMKSVDAAADGGASLLAQIGRGIAFLTGLLSPAVWCAAGILLALALLALSALCYSRSEIKA